MGLFPDSLCFLSRLSREESELLSSHFLSLSFPCYKRKKIVPMSMLRERKRGVKVMNLCRPTVQRKY